MYINTFKYTPKDVSCQLCTGYVKKLGCTSSPQSPLISVSADGENCARSLAPPLPTKSATLRGPQTYPWLAERIEAGVVGYWEAVLETFLHERRLFQRLNLLIKHYPGSLWSNEQHECRMQYQRTVQGYRRRGDTNAYYAAMYLMHLRCAQAVFSHESALFFHDLTDREPSPYSITVKTGYNPTSLQADGIKVYTIKKELHDVGIATMNTAFGNPVPVYDMERTVCDLIRSLYIGINTNFNE